MHQQEYTGCKLKLLAVIAGIHLIHWQCLCLFGYFVGMETKQANLCRKIHGDFRQFAANYGISNSVIEQIS